MLRAAYTKLMAPVSRTTGAINDAKGYQELDGLLLFEEVVGSTHLAAAQVAAVGSGANALGGERSPRAPLELKSLLPPQLAVIADLARCQAQLRLNRDVLRAAALFAEELNSAHVQVSRFCDDVGSLGLHQASFLHLLPLRTTLRRLARHALKCIDCLGPDVTRCLPTSYTLNTEALQQLLTDVIDGQAPCVDAKGQIIVPQLPQRRPQSRRDVRLPCMVEHEGKTGRALLKDLSTGGAGLVNAPELTPGKVIIVELASQRCLSGVVVWAKGAKAGLKFDAPLKTADPLFAL